MLKDREKDKKNTFLFEPFSILSHAAHSRHMIQPTVLDREEVGGSRVFAIKRTEHSSGSLASPTPIFFLPPTHPSKRVRLVFTRE